MKASVIVPTYNRSDVILRSLQTWSNQSISAADFEIIVVDNNSTDNSAVLIQNFIKDSPNFKYIKESKTGSTSARHAGAKLAQADVLIFADDDGLFNSTCIEEILKVYQSNENIAAVAGKIDILWDKKPPEWIKPYEFMLGKLDYASEVLIGTDLYLNGGLFSIKKRVFEEFGGFNPDLIGEYLVGDGDTGLVIKLHKGKRLIGWTPFAQMQHLQLVDKQGTVEDMGRRFFNIGISKSYGLFRANNFKFKEVVIINILKSGLILIKKIIEHNFNGRKSRKIFFSLMQHKGELSFYVHLRKKEIRRIIKESV